MTETIVKIGPKGQILIKKEYREKLGLNTGSYAEAILEHNGLLIKPINTKKELEKVRRLREHISKSWPKGMDSVTAVREQRK